MSFRTRLTSFFILIVVVPMIAVGAMVFRLISDSQQGKGDARAGGLASAAASVYLGQAAAARVDAGTIAHQLDRTPAPAIDGRVRELLASTGLVRIVVGDGSRALADSGVARRGRTRQCPPAAARLRTPDRHRLRAVGPRPRPRADCRPRHRARRQPGWRSRSRRAFRPERSRIGSRGTEPCRSGRPSTER